jgi:cytochrome c oxidase subunit 3
MNNSKSTSNKIHPHKFQLWVAFASIIMAFSGLLSAYMVKMNQENWLQFTLPNVFTISTIVILISSATMHLALQNFKRRNMVNYRMFITTTAVLGCIFIALQIKGFVDTGHGGVKLVGRGSNASGSFLLAIAGFHILHVLGGVIALLVQFFRAFSSRRKNYSVVPVQVTAQYWHFVDILWIVLFLFFLVVKPN